MGANRIIGGRSPRVQKLLLGNMSDGFAGERTLLLMAPTRDDTNLTRMMKLRARVWTTLFCIVPPCSGCG